MDRALALTHGISPFNKFGTPPEITDGTSLIEYLTVSSIHIPAIHPADLVDYCFDYGSISWEHWMGLVQDSS